jgi:hypothetical protein
VTEIRQSGNFGRQAYGTANRRSWRSHLGILAAIMTIGAPVVLNSGSASASAAARVVNGPAQVVPGTTVLNGIACHGHDNCVAVGSNSSGEGVVVPVTDGIPGTAEPLSGITTLTAVNCPTTTLCVAVGYGPYTNPPFPATIAGFVVTVVGGNVSSENIVVGMNGTPYSPEAVYLYGVACSNTSSCLAGGYSNYLEDVILPIDNGYPQNEVSVYAGSGLDGVACRQVDCLAVGNDGLAGGKYGEGLVEFDIAGMPPYFEPAQEARNLNGVACRNGVWCAAVGSNLTSTEGVVLLVINQTLHNVEPVSGSTVLKAVACRAEKVYCLAVGDNSSNAGVVAGIYDGTPGSARAVVGTTGLNGVACPTKTSCLVVGTNASGEGALAMIHLPPL